MTTADAFAHWTGGACTEKRVQFALCAEAARQLGETYPCCAGAGVGGSGLSGDDLSRWLHAVGAQAAALFLESPAGRRGLTSTTRTRSRESGSGDTACDPKVVEETVEREGSLDAAQLAQAARADVQDHMMRIACVKAALRPKGRVSLFGASGPSRARRCGRC